MSPIFDENGVANVDWLTHAACMEPKEGAPYSYRIGLMAEQVKTLFGFIPDNLALFSMLSMISQAEAKKYFIERMRVGRPDKTGIIWWNLLDGWPQMSDAVVDYYFTKKLAYSYIKRSQAPFVIAAGELSNWHLPIYACNDTLTEKSGRLTVKDAESGDVIHECDFVAGANTSTLIARLPIYYSDEKVLVFEWTVGEEKGFNHYLCGTPPISLERYRAIIKKYNL